MNNSLWGSAWRVGLVLLIGLASSLILQIGLRTIEKRLRRSSATEEHLKRLTTLVHAGRSIGLGVILLTVLLMILHELGINITPVLASAGVVGLTFSLGAQTFIKDFIGGIIILWENQFTIGDVVTIGQYTGTVEHITLRATYLRDTAGQLNLIPNGDVRTISNLTTQWSQVVITFNIDYEADMEQVLRILEDVSRVVQNDQDLASAILEPPDALGWTDFTDWAVQAQMIAKTQPGKQWMVARALRKTALELFQKNGVRIATPLQRITKIA